MDIAVVIPVHNKAPHLERAIRSVLAQTVAAREIILVDDASTDGSADIAESFRSVPGVELLRRDTPGAGGYAARNLAISASRSSWIAFLDADDEWTPNHLASIAAHSDGVGGVFTGFETVMPGLGRVRSAFAGKGGEARRLDFDALLDLWLQLRACPIWTGAVAFRRDILIDAGLFPEGRCRRGGDKDLWLRACARTDVAGTPGVTATYHADSVNMVTRATPQDCAHCMAPTIASLLAGASAARALRLKRVYNMQAWEYVYAGWRAGTSAPAAADGFFHDAEPLRSIILRLMQATATPVVAEALRRPAALRQLWRRRSEISN